MRDRREAVYFILNLRVPRRVPGKRATRRHGPHESEDEDGDYDDFGRARCPHRAAGS